MKSLIEFMGANGGGSLFDAAMRYLTNEGVVLKIRGESASDFSSKFWPKAPGVYVIRKSEDNCVLYIGMTGKVSGRDGGVVDIGGGRLDQRATRWTPYVFQRFGTYRDHLEFGPNFGNAGGKPPTTSDDNYRFHFPLASINVECINLAERWRDITPTFLESLLLQTYLREKGCLPVGNQEF